MDTQHLRCLHPYRSMLCLVPTGTSRACACVGCKCAGFSTAAGAGTGAGSGAGADMTQSRCAHNHLIHNPCFIAHSCLEYHSMMTSCLAQSPSAAPHSCLEMYLAVDPHSGKAQRPLVLTLMRDSPKSAILATPSSFSRMFWGFKLQVIDGRTDRVHHPSASGLAG